MGIRAQASANVDRFLRRVWHQNLHQDFCTVGPGLFESRKGLSLMTPIGVISVLARRIYIYIYMRLPQMGSTLDVE